MQSWFERLLRAAVPALALGVAACGNATPEPPPDELSDPGPQDASFDGALSFDGVDDYVSIGTARMPQIQRDQTLMLWFLPKASKVAAADELQTMFSLHRAGWSGIALALRGGITLITSVYSKKDLATAATAVTLDQWHHAAVLLNRESTELFIDGVSVATGEAPGQNRTPIEAYLGSADGYHQLFHGLLDEVQVYPRSFSPEEIAEVARGVRADAADAPVLYLSFNEARGARCYDRSGLGNHAELGDGVVSLMPAREKSEVPNEPRVAPAMPAP